MARGGKTWSSHLNPLMVIKGRSSINVNWLFLLKESSVKKPTAVITNNHSCHSKRSPIRPSEFLIPWWWPKDRQEANSYYPGSQTTQPVCNPLWSEDWNANRLLFCPKLIFCYFESWPFQKWTRWIKTCHQPKPDPCHPRPHHSMRRF